MRAAGNKIEVVARDDQHRALGEGCNPFFIQDVKAFQITAGDTSFKASPAGVNAFQKRVHGGTQINHQVGRGEQVNQNAVKVLINAVIAGAHILLKVKVASENLRVLIDRAILNHRALGIQQLLMDAQAAREKVELGMERPGFHVAVKVFQIGIVIHRLKKRLEAKPFAQDLNQGGFARANIACHNNELIHSACFPT